MFENQFRTFRFLHPIGNNMNPTALNVTQTTGLEMLSRLEYLDIPKICDKGS